jgi:hypothetical protein
MLAIATINASKHSLTGNKIFPPWECLVSRKLAGSEPVASDLVWPVLILVDIPQFSWGVVNISEENSQQKAKTLKILTRVNRWNDSSYLINWLEPNDLAFLVVAIWIVMNYDLSTKLHKNQLGLHFTFLFLHRLSVWDFIPACLWPHRDK